MGTGLGANGSELHAFNERPGMKVALAIQAPAGAGIVEIDERASRVDAFTDDKGQSLLEEGRFGPFSKLSEDRSAALVQVEVHGRPSPGAAAVNVQGTVGMTLAAGAKPTRLANVRLEPARTMKLGAATITVKSVTPRDESTALSFGLSRTLLNTIKGVRFFDAKGEVIESHRSGSGYMNDAAEVEFQIKSKETVVSVEFDVWQNMRQIKLPFSLTAGLSIGDARAVTAAPVAAPPVEPRPVPRAAAPTVAPGPNDGAASVDAVVAKMQSAAASGKGRELLAVIFPDDRPTYGQAIAVGLAFSAMAHIDDPKLSERVQKDIDAIFAKHKLQLPLNREPAELFKNADLGAFVTDAFAYLKLQLKGQEFTDALPVPKGKPQDVKLEGDSALAKLGDKDVNFARVNNKWFIRLVP